MPKETMKTLFRRAEEVLTLEQKLAERIGGLDVGYEGDFEAYCRQGGAYLYIAGIFLHSAADDFGAIFLLLQKEFINGAFLSLRRLVELDIDLRFIGNCPAERSKRFLYFGSIQQEKSIQALERAELAQTAGADEDKRDLIRADYEVAMKFLANKKAPSKAPSQWSRHNWKSKCQEIDRKLRETNRELRGTTFERTYEVIYRRCCAYTHPSAWGLANFVEDVQGEKPTYTQPAKEKPLIAALAVSGFLDIILNVNRIFSAGLDEEITQIYQGMQGWGRI